MEATFQITPTYRVTGTIQHVRISLGPGVTMLGTRFEAQVSPGVGLEGVPRLRIDRVITVHGAKLKTDGTPGAAPGKVNYWLSEESNPVWVREIALAIESTECPRIANPGPIQLTVPS